MKVKIANAANPGFTMGNAMLAKVIYLETDGAVVETTPEEIR